MKDQARVVVIGGGVVGAQSFFTLQKWDGRMLSYLREMS